MRAILQAVDVHKSYRTGHAAVSAVKGVSLQVEAGETVAIVGPSGSGKSTLLNLLGGLDRPSSGEVRIGGVALSGLSDDDLTRLRRKSVGLIFQFFNLLPLLSARENVALPLLLAGSSFDEADERAGELLDLVGLGARMGHRPDQLSGGEMQRVAVARALSQRPLLLLADEPTGNLDSASGAIVQKMLLDAASNSGCALIIITHDVVAARRADRVVDFKDGKIVSESAPSRPTPGAATTAHELPPVRTLEGESECAI
ncbi:MAG: Lipoprotein-releasing system ATP-binding protein LolD [Pseudomonadota bacterium]|jgi:putative ABC transport system ATP-binding protein